MGIKSLIQLAAAFAVLAAPSGKLSTILRQVRVVQLHLLMDSRASEWGQVLLPSSSKR
jgi:hypothetical protein